MSGALAPAPSAYLSVVEEGTRRYLEHLRALAGRSSRAPRELALREVARPLARLLENVLRTRRLTPAEVRIPEAPLIRAEGHPELLNPWAVGLGNPLAPFLVLGPEPEYALDRFEFLLEGLLLQALWLTNADVHVVAGVLGRPAWSELPFQRYPNDLYLAPSRSTWGRVAALIARAWGGDTRDLLRPKLTESNTAPHLFDDAYLLDLSTVPSAWRSITATPASEREAFLGELLPALPETRLLFIHGRQEDSEWSTMRTRLAARFLGLPLQDVTDCLQTERPTRTWDELHWFLHGDRGVLFSVSLHHEVEEGYWERSVVIIRMLMPELPRGPAARSAD